jgi:hypothetical protein
VRPDNLADVLRAGSREKEELSRSEHLGVGRIKEESADAVAYARPAGLARGQDVIPLLLEEGDQELHLGRLAAPLGTLKRDE